MKTKFIHLRCHDKTLPGINDIEARGGLTIAYFPIKEDKKVFWAMARCHPHDNYNKSVGRAKASGRLLKEEVNFMVYDKDIPTNKEIVKQIKECIYFELEERNPDIRYWLY